MKRALQSLERDQLRLEVDALVRSQLLVEEEENAARVRKDARSAVLTTKWRQHLEKWEEMGLHSLENHSVDPPSPSSSLGTFLSLESLSHHSLPLSHYPGASLMSRVIPRGANALDVLKRVIPRVIFRRLLNSVQSHIARAKTLSSLSDTRRTPLPKTPDDLMKVFMMRMYAACKRIETIAALYADPDVLSFPHQTLPS